MGGNNIISNTKINTNANHNNAQSIKSKYNDCYYIKGNIIDFEFFQKLNIDYAYTLILLSSREEMLSVDGEKINSISLFNYLKLELWVPPTVFFTIGIITFSLSSADCYHYHHLYRVKHCG